MTTSERAPLSLQLEFLRMMDGGGAAGPFGPRYTIVAGWRVIGGLNSAVLKESLDYVVARHEALRTQVVFADGEAYQRIVPPDAARLTTRKLPETAPEHRERVVEEFLNEVEAEVSITTETPRMRAVLGRFDDHDGVLAIVAHHSLVDGWSMQVLMRDLTACYAARRAGGSPQLPPVRQYRDYVAWQQERADSAAVRKAQEFWRRHLDGARVLPVPNDRPRTPDPYTTGWHRFMLEDGFRTATLAAARQYRSSPFMVLMAAFMVMLRDRTGVTDLVVPTLTTGRDPSWTLDVIGTFYNFMPLRADLSGCRDFADVVATVRASCLATYPNELPFLQVVTEAPELMSAVMDPGAAAVAFQVIQHGVALDGQTVDGLRFDAIRRRVVSTPVGSQIPDGILAELDLHPDGGMFGKVAYTRHMYDEETVTGMVADLRRTLLETVVGRSVAA
ncbi:condensation domain-containing protein [Dactylosporangium sp. NPDC049140]|uniref:condensation domain-containing protein n=1 Tax=Dactylosporangium sp. NPDC049140 TaxID=3155647 RepID=UPI0033D171F0